MEVYFDGNFWGHTDGERPGKQISLKQEFMWEGQRWQIPAVYSCQKGLVVDFCVLVPKAEVETFLKKWNQAKRLSSLTKDEMDQMERERPFSLNFKTEIKINGVVAQSKHMCAMGWHPCKEGQEFVESESVKLMDTYHCDRNNGWWFVRAGYLWPEDRMPNRMPELKTLELCLSADPVRYSGQHFKVKENDSPQEIAIKHPVTNEEFKLRILGSEAGCMPEESFGEDGVEYPTHFQALSYSIEPELSQEVFRIEDCEQGDPIRKNGKKHGACAVGIIGGTSSSLLGFNDLAGTDIHRPSRVSTVYSALHYKPVCAVEWRTLFFQKEKEDKVVLIQI